MSRKNGLSNPTASTSSTFGALWDASRTDLNFTNKHIAILLPVAGYSTVRTSAGDDLHYSYGFHVKSCIDRAQRHVHKHSCLQYKLTILPIEFS
jgi:hypothetical protein